MNIHALLTHPLIIFIFSILQVACCPHISLMVYPGPASPHSVYRFVSFAIANVHPLPAHFRCSNFRIHHHPPASSTPLVSAVSSWLFHPCNEYSEMCPSLGCCHRSLYGLRTCSCIKVSCHLIFTRGQADHSPWWVSCPRLSATERF